MCCHAFWNLYMSGDLFKKWDFEIRGSRACNMRMTLLSNWPQAYLPSKEDLPSIKRIKILLYIFELVSGSSINFHKSSIYPLGPPSLALSTISGVFHCIIGNFSFSYLGVPLKPVVFSNADRQPLLDRFDKRLATWKGHSLSRGGGLILVNSVLSSLPLYFMSFFYLSQRVVQHIEKLRRAFFWNEKNNINGGQCLVSWDDLCSPRGSDGLGIRRLRDFNISLLFKWWWKLSSNHQSSWVKVVLHNYYRRHRPLDLQDKLPGRVSPFWRGFLKLWTHSKWDLGFVVGIGPQRNFGRTVG